MKHPPETLITVCDACLCASCWQYIFLCERYRSAGTRRMTVAQLRELGHESESYWKTDAELANQ